MVLSLTAVFSILIYKGMYLDEQKFSVQASAQTEWNDRHLSKNL